MATSMYPLVSSVIAIEMSITWKHFTLLNITCSKCNNYCWFYSLCSGMVWCVGQNSIDNTRSRQYHTENMHAYTRNMHTHTLYTHAHAHTCTHTHTHMHACMRVQAHTHKPVLPCCLAAHIMVTKPQNIEPSEPNNDWTFQDARYYT